jgi:hypothetical protein
MKMTKTDLTKKIVKFVVSSSIGFTVTAALKNNTPVTKTHHKVQVLVAAYVIGRMVSEKAEVWTEAKIDSIIETWDRNKKDTVETQD